MLPACARRPVFSHPFWHRARAMTTERERRERWADIPRSPPKDRPKRRHLRAFGLGACRESRPNVASLVASAARAPVRCTRSAARTRMPLRNSNRNDGNEVSRFALVCRRARLDARDSPCAWAGPSPTRPAGFAGDALTPLFRGFARSLAGHAVASAAALPHRCFAIDVSARRYVKGRAGATLEGTRVELSAYSGLPRPRPRHRRGPVGAPTRVGGPRLSGVPLREYRSAGRQQSFDGSHAAG